MTSLILFCKFTLEVVLGTGKTFLTFPRKTPRKIYTKTSYQLVFVRVCFPPVAHQQLRNDFNGDGGRGK